MQDADILALLEARQYGEAFAPLLEQFKDKVFRLSFSILRNETHAEDVTQDVLVRIWKGLPSYHGGASLSTWIYTITRNTCFTELKRRDRHPTVSLQEPAMESASNWIPALQFAGPEPGLEMDVDVLMAKLPENYRRVIALFYLEQKSYEEVALMLGIPLGTVKTLLFRAKKEMLRLHSREEQTMPVSAKPSQTNPKKSGAIPPLAALPGVGGLLKLFLL